MAESTDTPEGDTTAAPTTVESAGGETGVSEDTAAAVTDTPEQDPTPAEGTNPVVVGAVDTSDADAASKDDDATAAEQAEADVRAAQAEHLKNSPEHQQEAADNAQANADNADTFVADFPRFESSEHYHGQVKESQSGAIVVEVVPVGWVGPWLTVGYERVGELIDVLTALEGATPDEPEEAPAS